MKRDRQNFKIFTSRLTFLLSARRIQCSQPPQSITNICKNLLSLKINNSQLFFKSIFKMTELGKTCWQVQVLKGPNLDLGNWGNVVFAVASPRAYLGNWPTSQYIKRIPWRHVIKLQPMRYIVSAVVSEYWQFGLYPAFLCWFFSLNITNSRRFFRLLVQPYCCSFFRGRKHSSLV